MSGSTRVMFCALALVVLAAGRAWGDEEGAKKYISEAKEAMTNRRPETAETKLKLAETELEGLDAAKKRALETEIAAIRKEATDAVMAEERIRMNSNIKSAMNKVTSAAENPNRAGEVLFHAKELEAYLADAQVKKVLGEAEIAKVLKELSAYKKVAASADMADNLQRLKTALDELEKKMPKHLEEVGREGGNAYTVHRDFQSDVGSVERWLKNLPADDAKVAPEAGRLKKMQDQFNAAAMKSQTAAALKSMKEQWDSAAKDFAGWEKETLPPAFKDAMYKSGPEAFNTVKTAEMIRRVTNWLEINEQSENVKAVMADPQVKGMIEQAKKMRETGTASALKSIEAVAAEAEKAKIDKSARDRLQFMGNAVEMTLGREHPKVAEYEGRFKKLVEKFDGEVEAKGKATEELYQKMRKDAEAAWPAIAAKYGGAVENFNPQDAEKMKGKTIRLKNVQNWMGYSFEGDFDFAETVNGLPVAGKYAPEIHKAIEEMADKTGKSLYNDRFDVIAVVEGTGKMVQVLKSESTVRGEGGGRATINEQRKVPVDTAVVRIIAMHAGPIAIGSAGGGVSAASLTGAGGGGGGAGSSAVGGGGGAWVWRVVTLLLGLVAALAALLKANFAPLAATPQGAAINAKVGGERLAYIGIACAVLGLVWLARGYVIYGLLVSLAIIAAGLYAALDLLEAKGIVKPDLAAKVRPLGVQIGLACAAVAVLQLITGGKLIVI